MVDRSVGKFVDWRFNGTKSKIMNSVWDKVAHYAFTFHIENITWKYPFLYMYFTDKTSLRTKLTNIFLNSLIDRHEWKQRTIYESQFLFHSFFQNPFFWINNRSTGHSRGKKRGWNARNLKIEIECNSFYLYNRGKFFEYGKKEQKTERKTAETQNRCANK